MPMAERAAATLNCSDVFRSYDMVKALSISEVLDRQSKLYSVAANFPRNSDDDAETPRRYVGGSGEHLVTAALGGVIQPMDSNVRGVPYPKAFEVYVNGPPGRWRMRREDEIERCVQWAVLAPPFGAGQQRGGVPDSIKVDSVILWDNWAFSLCDDACTLHRHLVNRTVRQGAPARVTRGGLPLPLVSIPATTSAATPLLPFVVATRYPNSSAVLLTSMGRTSAGAGWVEPSADVTLTVPGPMPPLVGLLGHFGSVTLHFSGSIGYGCVYR